MVLNLTFVLIHHYHIEYALLSFGLSLQSKSLAELLHTLLDQRLVEGTVKVTRVKGKALSYLCSS